MFKINKDIEVGNGKLLFIAGPCVIESLELCLKTAEFLKKLADKLKINYVFKASFDKANRSAVTSYRGKGLESGLKVIQTVKKKLGVPVLTDVHNIAQVARTAEVVDVLQIPAFLCRQTDLLLEVGRTGKPVNIKKGQFMAPADMKGAVDKIESVGNKKVMLTERGSSFGYHNLVVDMRSLSIMRNIGVPIVFDATHSVQLPGSLGNSTGGQKQFVEPLALAATAIGIDALFMEVHPKPEEALSDGPNSLNFEEVERTLKKVKVLYELEQKSFKN